MAGRKQPQQPRVGDRLALRATAYFDFPFSVDAERTAPTEFRVFPAGSFQTVKGTFVFSPRSAESVMKWHASRQLPLMGDYEHMTDEPARGNAPIIAPASITEMTPEVRKNAAGGGELWVTSVRWTKRAREMLQAGEYRFFSPTFLHDPETKEVLALLRIALTNDPAINDLEPLVAASSAAGDGKTPTDEGEGIMGDESTKCARCETNDALVASLQQQHATLKAAYDEVIGQHRTLKEAHDGLAKKHEQLAGAHEAIMKSFEDWAAEEAEEHEGATAASLTAQMASGIVKRLRALARDIKTLAGQKSGSAALGTLTAWKTAAGELVTMKADADKKAQEKLSADLKSLTDKAVAEGKMPPAQRDHYLERAKADGAAPVLQFLTGMLGATTPVVNRAETTPPDPTTSAALATLSAPIQAEAAKFFGGSISLEDMAKAKTAYDKHLQRMTAGARQ